MKLQSRATVFAAIGGLLAMMGGFVYYASLDNSSLEQVQLGAGTIEVADIDTVNGVAKLRVTFPVTNPSDLTFTIPSISYDIYWGGDRVGSGEYSTVDVAMPGRVLFSPGVEIPLSSLMYVTKTAENASLYDAVIGGSAGPYTADAKIIVESAWSVVELEKSVDVYGT